MKILITGANGLLGQHLTATLAKTGHQVIATGKGASRLPDGLSDNVMYVEMDFTNDAQIEAVFSSQLPEIVVHAGAMTQLDDCEKNQDLCFETNVQGTAQVLLSAERFSKYFLYVSTDFVFDGEKGNYKEEDELNPISWYGFTKVQAESTVETSEIPWAIVRTCLVYGNPLAGTRSNILTWVKSSLEAEKQIQVVNDQHRTPTYVADLVNGIVLMIEKRATGVFHISGDEFMTPYEMAICLAKRFNFNQNLISQVDAGNFTQPAKRPPKTGFDISRAREILGYRPGKFEENLEKIWPGSV